MVNLIVKLCKHEVSVENVELLNNKLPKNPLDSWISKLRVWIIKLHFVENAKKAPLY